MLVQKRKKTRKSFILWGVVGVLFALSIFLVYQNISSTSTTKPSTLTNTTITKLPVPQDFGQSIFSDPRFNEIANPQNSKNQLSTIYVDQMPIEVLDANRLPVPEDFSVSNPGYGGKLFISWKNSSTDDVLPSTSLYRSSSVTSGFEQIAYLQSSVSTYTDEDVINDQTYYYRVKAVVENQLFASRQLTPGEADTIQLFADDQPGSQRTVRVDSFEGSNAVVSWDDFTQYGLQAIQIKRIRDGVGRVVATYTSTNNLEKLTSDASFVDADGASGDAYQLIAFTLFKESDFSSTEDAIPQDVIPPEAPSDISIVNGGDGNSVKIFWTNPLDSDFDYVKIYRSSVQGVLGDVIKSTRTEYMQKNGTCVGTTDENDIITTDSTATAPEGDCYINNNALLEGETYYYTLTSVDTSGNESPKRIIGQIGRGNPFIPL